MKRDTSRSYRYSLGFGEVCSDIGRSVLRARESVWYTSYLTRSWSAKWLGKSGEDIRQRKLQDEQCKTVIASRSKHIEICNFGLLIVLPHVKRNRIVVIDESSPRPDSYRAKLTTHA